MNNIELIDKKYKWKYLSLIEFLTEGNIPSKWEDFFLLKDTQISLLEISDKLKEEKRYIFPRIEQVFRAFYLTDPNTLKLIIAGQDPYHTPNKSAIGLAFSVKKGNDINPSLKNIYNELKNEGFNIKETEELFHWTEQGIFLINSALTVVSSSPGSHSNIWKKFYILLVNYLVNNTQNLCWLLMGKSAQEIKDKITNNTHKIFCTSHPSPFSYKITTKNCHSLYNSNVFKEINNYLKEKKFKEIKW